MDKPIQTRLVMAGVPQGSMMGPLLFLLFMDDLLRLPIEPKISCYAHETKLFGSAGTEEAVKLILESDLRRVSK